MYSRKSNLKIVVKVSLAALVAAGFLGASSVNALSQRNWSEFVALCRAQGLVAYPNPPRCEAPSDGGNSTPLRAGEAAAAAAAAEREAAAAAEADRIERERLAEEKRKKDAEFIRNRNRTASTLKGSIGTSVSPSDGRLRGSSSVDTGLRVLGSAAPIPGPQGAWKQLHCAAALSGYAFAALSKPTPDYQESSYLAGQASKAMAGESLSVDCGTAPPMPNLRGNAADWDRLRQTQQRMIERVTTLSQTIRAGQQARAKYEPAAPVIAAQNAINRGQERKYDPKDAAAIREEQKAKAELEKYVDATKKLQAGDPSAMLDLGVNLGEGAPPAPTRGAAKP